MGDLWQVTNVSPTSSDEEVDAPITLQHQSHIIHAQWLVIAAACYVLQVKVTLHWILGGVGLGFNQAVWKWCYYLTEMVRLWFLVKRFMIKHTVWFPRSVSLSLSYFRVPYKMYMLCRSLYTVDKLWIFTKWKKKKKRQWKHLNRVYQATNIHFYLFSPPVYCILIVRVIVIRVKKSLTAYMWMFLQIAIVPLNVALSLIKD